MLSNYLTIAWRNMLRYKAYSFINLLGLAIGMAACLCVAVFVRYQYAFDRFHADTIYRLYEIHNQSGQAQSVAQTRFPVAPTLQQEFAEIKNTVRITSWEQVPLQHTNQSVSMGTLFGADPSFLQLFHFKLLRGNAKTALAKPGTIILTQKLAQQLFGNGAPWGNRCSIAGGIQSILWLRASFRTSRVNRTCNSTRCFPIRPTKHPTG